MLYCYAIHMGAINIASKEKRENECEIIFFYVQTFKITIVIVKLDLKQYHTAMADLK